MFTLSIPLYPPNNNEAPQSFWDYFCKDQGTLQTKSKLDPEIDAYWLYVRYYNFPVM